MILSAGARVGHGNRSILASYAPAPNGRVRLLRVGR